MPALLFVVLGLGMLCATAVCIVAICRAHQRDVPALVRELPELARALLGRRRSK